MKEVVMKMVTILYLIGLIFGGVLIRLLALGAMVTILNIELPWIVILGVLLWVFNPAFKALNQNWRNLRR